MWSHWCACFGLLVTSTLGFKAWLASILCCLYNPQIHLWCNTCRTINDQHGSLFDPLTFSTIGGTRTHATPAAQYVTDRRPHRLSHLGQ